MHDGSQKTVEEVVEFYNKGGEKNENLKALDGPSINVAAPSAFPQ